MFPRTPKSLHAKRHLDRFCRFCTAHGCAQHRHTDHVTCAICSNRPHLLQRMRPRYRMKPRIQEKSCKTLRQLYLHRMVWYAKRFKFVNRGQFANRDIDRQQCIVYYSFTTIRPKRRQVSMKCRDSAKTTHSIYGNELSNISTKTIHT